MNSRLKRTGKGSITAAARTAALVLIMLAAGGPAPAALGQAAEELLTSEADRWREFGHGVSFRPPAGFEVQEHTAEGALVTMISAPMGVQMRFFIKKSKVPLASQTKVGDRTVRTSPILNIVDIAEKEMRFHAPAVTVKQTLRRVAGQAGAVVYYRVKDGRGGDWIVGQAFVVINDQTFGLWQLEVDLHRATYGRRVFEAVVDSAQMEEPQRLKQWREQLTQDALAWHDRIDTSVLHGVLVPEQWFKIHQGDRLVGWMLVTQRQGHGLEKAEWERDQEEQTKPDLNAADPRGAGRRQRQQPVQRDVPGVRVDIRARIHSQHKQTVLAMRQGAGPLAQQGQIANARNDVMLSAVDLDSRLFLSNDRSLELWKRRITVRPMVAQRNALGHLSELRTHPDLVHANWVESGYRQDDVIAVALDGPTGSKLYEWPAPPRRIKEKYERRLPNGAIDAGFEIKDGFCYLSQVELWLLERLLPRNKANEFGFYAYRGPNIYDLPGVNTHSGEVKGNLAFRMVRSVPREDGSLRIEMYPTLDRVAEIGLYDQLGGLISKSFAGGLKLTPTTANELAALKSKFK